MSGSFETFGVKPFIHLWQSHPPVRDKVAPFSAARRSAELGTNAFTSPKSFGCGCAALRGSGKNSNHDRVVSKNCPDDRRPEFRAAGSVKGNRTERDGRLASNCAVGRTRSPMDAVL